MRASRPRLRCQTRYPPGTRLNGHRDLAQPEDAHVELSGALLAGRRHVQLDVLDLVEWGHVVVRRGSVSTKVAPLSGSLVTSRLPCMARASWRLMASPRPTP